MNAHMTLPSWSSADVSVFAGQSTPTMARNPDLVRKIPSMLMQLFGFTEEVAREMAEAVYDSHVVAFKKAPTSVGFIGRGLAKEEGLVRLRALVLQMFPFQTPVVALKAHTNELLEPAVALRLQFELMQALQTGQDDVDRVLLEIVTACRTANQPYFVTPFKNFTEASVVVIERSKALQLKFGFYWTEGAQGIDLNVTWRFMPVHEQERLTALLRAAVRSCSARKINEALSAIGEVCAQHKQTAFKVPYRDGTDISGMLVARLRAGKFPVHLHWDLNGLLDEPALAPTTASVARRQERAARKQANREDRLKVQPKKGRSGDKPSAFMKNR